MLTRLFNRLNRVFNREPAGIAGVSVTSNPNSATVTVKVDGVTVTAPGMAKTTISGNTLQQLTAAMAGQSPTGDISVIKSRMEAVTAINTVADLVTLLTGTYGCTATCTATLADKEVNWLVEGAYNGDVFTIPFPTSILYTEFQTYARMLEEQVVHLRNATQQAYLTQAEGEWLDIWCRGYFGITRYADETDEEYANRTLYEVLRPTQNNKALELIVRDALGIPGCQIVDAYAEEAIDANRGRFILHASMPSDWSAEKKSTMTARIYDTVRRYKAAGKDFLLHQHEIESQLETINVTELPVLAITMGFSESPYTTEVRVGDGWRVGKPGLRVGAKPAELSEQIFIRKILVADGSVVSSELL